MADKPFKGSRKTSQQPPASSYRPTKKPASLAAHPPRARQSMLNAARNRTLQLQLTRELGVDQEEGRGQAAVGCAGRAARMAFVSG